MVNVTKDNFIQVSDDFLRQLATAAYVAIDEEMTGITLPSMNNRKPPPKDDTTSQRYERLKAVPETYSIIQLGVCLFHKNEKYRNSKKQRASVASPPTSDKKAAANYDTVAKAVASAASHSHGNEDDDEGEDDRKTSSLEEGEEEGEVGEDDDEEGEIEEEQPEYIARPYNFYLFPAGNENRYSYFQRAAGVPPPRDITLSASAIQFLNQHGMDLGLWTKAGVSYMTTESAYNLIKKIEEEQYGASTTPPFYNPDARQEAAATGEGCNNDGGNGNSDANAEDIKPDGVTLKGIAASNAVNLGISPPSNKNSSGQQKNNNNKRRRVELTRQHDVEFVSRTMAHLREWLDNSTRAIPVIPEGSDASQYSQLILPSCNAFLRRALYEVIGETYPSLILEKGQGPLHKDCIVVYRMSQEEKEERQRQKEQQLEYDVKCQIGFTRLFQALVDACHGTFDPRVDPETGSVRYLLPQKPGGGGRSSTSTALSTSSGGAASSSSAIQSHRVKAQHESMKRFHPASNGTGIPIIVHNGLMDLLFLMTHFVCSELPTSWSETKEMIHNQFPSIYDTKCLAEQFVDRSVTPIDSTALSNLYHACHDHHLTPIVLPSSTSAGSADAASSSNPSQRAVGFNASAGPDDNSGAVRVPQNHAAYHHGFIELHSFFRPRYIGGGNGENTMLNNDDEQGGNESNSLDVTSGAHEAAYDAFMTGECYFHLMKTILNQLSEDESATSKEADGSSSSFPPQVEVHRVHTNEDLDRDRIGTNKLLCWGTMYNIDLEGTSSSSDPLRRGLHPSGTFRVTNVDPAVTTRDIHNSLRDDSTTPSNYEVIWIDDTTFMVATKASNLWIPPDFHLKNSSVIGNSDNSGDANDDDNNDDQVVSTTEGIVPDSDVSTLALELQEYRRMALTVKRALQERFGSAHVIPVDEYWQQNGINPPFYGTEDCHDATFTLVGDTKNDDQCKSNKSNDDIPVSRKRGLLGSVVSSIVDYMPFKRRRTGE